MRTHFRIPAGLRRWSCPGKAVAAVPGLAPRMREEWPDLRGASNQCLMKFPHLRRSREVNRESAGQYHRHQRDLAYCGTVRSRGAYQHVIVPRGRTFARYLSISFGAWLAVCAFAGVVAVEGALHPGRRILQPQDEALVRQIAIDNHADFGDVAISASDGASLRAWSIHPNAPKNDAVILLHGQSDNRAGMLGIADMLLRHGVAVLLPDARAHGESGGSIATYGFLEADDVRRWVQWLDRTESPRCIYGIGDSMGGAELLTSLGAGTAFCAVIAESTFSSFRSASYERLGQAFHTGPWLGRTLLRPAVESAFVYAQFRYGVDLAQVSPRRAVASTGVPVMLIHGLADTNLVPVNSERIRQANARVVLWEPAGAGHCGASSAAPEEYERRVIDWFATHNSLH